MKIKFLGTAAAEGIPALFCKCEICENARKKGGKEIRTRHQAIVDDKLLIDFNGDTYMHILNHGLDLTKVHSCIVTHSHFDHLNVADLWCRCRTIANNIEEIPFSMYLTESGYNMVNEFIDKYKEPIEGRVEANKITAFEEFKTEGYTITPLRAKHDPNSTPVIYIIEKDGKTLFYSCDTAVYYEETFEYFKNCKKHFDLIAIDCTGGLMPQNKNEMSHMCFEDNLYVLDKLAEFGLRDENTKVVMTHISHNAHTTHEQLVKAAEEKGFFVAYDGMEIEF